MFVFQVEIVLNFFPGDHSTADKYKRFVQKLTKVMFVLIIMMIIYMLTLFVLMIIMINKVMRMRLMRMIMRMRMMTDGNWKFAKGTCNAMWWHSAPHSR